MSTFVEYLPPELKNVNQVRCSVLGSALKVIVHTRRLRGEGGKGARRQVRGDLPPRGVWWVGICQLKKKRIMTWAMITRMNMVRGYTVEYATAGASLLATLLPYASAGGSVYPPLIRPMMVR